ncbi:hypothetical protein C8Q80DRAFT_1092427 [Daedaleopsis nitida]|nr:hypothetical protein C8Q80DRAFT_1092427 [Daedaleopsis nitida]
MPDIDIKRDASLWFDDGNIIMIASQPETAFRVHKSILARHSETLSSLFTLPQPAAGPGAMATMDGCAVVRMTDSSHDLKHLLQALYDGASYWDADAVLERGVLTALARLGHKYELTQVLALAMKRLGQIYPNDYSVWRETVLDSSILTVSKSSTDTLHAVHLEVVNICRVTGQYSALPAAMVECSRLPVAWLLKGIIRADGTTEQLSADDLERCLSAKLEISKAAARFEVHLAGAIPASSCRTKAECRDFREQTADVSTVIIDRYPWCPVFMAAVRPWMRKGLGCGACSRAIVEHCEIYLKSQWNSFTKFTGLQDCVSDWPVVVALS